ncbi:hypothetical protein E2C01_067796 [Portunus trituberculatus]|uniref:Uncharacterized protein n=1 Tax=Portunus trituberculatus TaxID=210409 RepID=A0A5B7HUS6_PORTR|nr:hypothetical protein [Portunus trituberculatus]
MASHTPGAEEEVLMRQVYETAAQPRPIPPPHLVEPCPQQPGDENTTPFLPSPSLLLLPTSTPFPSPLRFPPSPSPVFPPLAAYNCVNLNKTVFTVMKKNGVMVTGYRASVHLLLLTYVFPCFFFFGVLLVFFCVLYLFPV